jgi:hypothetical protein
MVELEGAAVGDGCQEQEQGEQATTPGLHSCPFFVCDVCAFNFGSSGHGLCIGSQQGKGEERSWEVSVLRAGVLQGGASASLFSSSSYT